MSFADISGLQASAAASSPSTPLSPSTKTSIKLEQFQRQVRTIERTLKSESTSDLQDRIKYTMILQEEVAKALATMSDSHVMQKRKLCKDFDGISQQLEALVTQLKVKEQLDHDQLVESSISGDVSEDTIEFQQLEYDIAHNEAVIAEREADIAKIHQSVQQVNEIFRDLATIVNEQQTTIDDIESHIQESHLRTQQGLEQVQKAAEAQRTCCLQ